MREDTKPDRPASASRPDAPPTAARQPYQSPVLVEYGSVAKLTRGSLSINADGPSGFKSLTCL